jgi:hypothetical protein
MLAQVGATMFLPSLGVAPIGATMFLPSLRVAQVGATLFLPSGRLPPSRHCERSEAISPADANQTHVCEEIASLVPRSQ